MTDSDFTLNDWRRWRRSLCIAVCVSETRFWIHAASGIVVWSACKSSPEISSVQHWTSVLPGLRRQTISFWSRKVAHVIYFLGLGLDVPLNSLEVQGSQLSWISWYSWNFKIVL